MPLPSSGPISIADIRNEGVSGGCYSAGSPYSLGSLATAFGIPTDPDAMSEFYGKSCPSSGYTVTLYIRQGIATTPAGDPADVYTSTDGINYTYRGTTDNTICTALIPFTVSAGATLYIGVYDPFFTSLYYNAAGNTTTCPTNTAAYCVADGVAFTSSINANTNIAVSAYVQKFGSYLTCFVPPPN